MRHEPFFFFFRQANTPPTQGEEVGVEVGGSVGGVHVSITAAQSAILNVSKPIRDRLGCLAFP